MNDFRDYIAHHGIKGQKWGVKNGPPYPLDASDHNARERKANWKSSLNKGDDVKKKKPVHKAVETSRRRSKKTVGGNGELHYTEHDTSTDRKVKDDYNSMTDKEFSDKYHISKSIYAKRAEKAERKGYSVYKNAKERSDKMKNSVVYKALTALTPKKLKNRAVQRILNKKAGGLNVSDFSKNALDDKFAKISLAALATSAVAMSIAAIAKTSKELSKVKHPTDKELKENKLKREAWDKFRSNPNNYTKEFMDYADNSDLKKGDDWGFNFKNDKKKHGDPFYSIDDMDLLDLTAQEYEEETGKSAYSKEFKYEPKTENSSTASITNQKVGSLVTPDNVKAGMSDETKSELLALSVETLATTAFVATMVGLSKMQANAETDRDFLNYKNTAKAKTLDELPKTKSNTTTDNHVKDNNPGYPSKGRTMNCVLCTTSMALREKGYDVTARTSPDGWDAKRVLNKMFTNVKNHNVRSFNSSKGIQKAENLIKGFGNGAYGNICVYWPQGGGHSMFFKNDGGSIKIFDGQSGKVYSLKDFDQKILGSMYIARLDQAIPNNNATAFVEPRR